MSNLPLSTELHTSQENCFVQIERDRLLKQQIRDRFDRLAPQRDRWQKRASYYYRQQHNYYRFLIPEGAKSRTGSASRRSPGNA